MNKRSCLIILLAITLILFTFNLSAKTSVLIDFSKLKANGNGLDPTLSLAEDDPKMKNYKDVDPVNRKQHMFTLLDFSRIAGTNYTEEEKKGMVISLASYNWKVELNSSASTVENDALSYCKEWYTKYREVLDDSIGQEVKEGQPTAPKPEGYCILGVRVHFPEAQYNNWALIRPPFDIPAYENITTDFKGNQLPLEEKNKKDNYGTKYNSYGVVKNVGALKSISIRVYGNQYKNSINILLKDDNFITSEYQFPDYLDFEGWRQITWNNPNYITDVANRDLYVIPLYPQSTPFIKLVGFRVYRQGDQLGGDFITYIKDVKVTYDEAILDREQPIEHEDAWHILQKRTERAREREVKTIGHNQILQFLESQKMDKSTSSE